MARVPIAELDASGRENDHRAAKFAVLAESVRHHIKEEEGEMLPKAKELKIDFEALGQQMLDRKEELKEDDIPAGCRACQGGEGPRTGGYAGFSQALSQETSKERSRASRTLEGY